MPSIRAIVAITLSVLIGLYCAYCYQLYHKQRDILFPGQFMRAPALVKGEPVEIADLALSFGRVPLWYRPAASRRPVTVVFFHGNAEFIGSVHDVIGGTKSLGLGLLLVEFPGYGSAQGKPSETTLDETSSAALHWLRKRIGDQQSIIAMGRSVGTGVAARLAQHNQLAGLILQSPYVSTMRMARKFNVPGFLVRDRYDNAQALALFTGPVLISHGRQDELIGFGQAEELASLKPHYELIALRCGHNGCPVNTPEYWTRVAQWAAQNQIAGWQPAPGPN